MVNTSDFKDRLSEILTHYELNATAFAEEIGVQRSSISHLLSGRNKPSLDFVMKVIRRFPEVNLYWLLNGKGSFPQAGNREQDAPPPESQILSEKTPPPAAREIEKIVLFYSDGSFKEFTPR